MNLRRLAPVLALLALAATGCATNPPEAGKTAEAQQAEVSCERTYRVGSMMPVKDCAPAMSPDERARLAAELENRIRPTASQPPGK